MKTINRSLLLLFSVALSLALTSCVSFSSKHSTKPAGYHVLAHAHNDYEHAQPLFDALFNRFYSVEADFWMVEGDLMVAHDRQTTKAEYKGTLKELYLDPLQKLVDEKGSVHGDGETFYLWLDIKDGRDEVHDILHALLKDYSMLTVYTDQQIIQKPVVAILTGDRNSKETYVKKYTERRVCRDSNYYSPDDPDADYQWTWYAVSWGRHFSGWDGTTPFPDDQKQELITIVNDIHSKGRKIRFYAAPDVPNYWRLALEAGVDLVNTDKLPELNRFLENYQP